MDVPIQIQIPGRGEHVEFALRFEYSECSDRVEDLGFMVEG